METPINPYATPASNPVRPFAASATVEFLDNAALFAWARTRMKGHFGAALGQIALYVVLAVVLQIVPSRIVNGLGSLTGLLLAPVLLGLYASYLRLVREDKLEVADLFGQLSRALPAIGLQLLMTLAILLGFLLLIVPGILLSLNFSLAFPLMADEGLGPIEALKRSSALMRGHRKQLLFLGFRFLLWGLLLIPTLGLFGLWLAPVFTAAFARFYEQVRAGSPANA